MPPLIPLPIEIVEHIITYVHDDILRLPISQLNSADTQFPDHTSIRYLLDLRLVARAWAYAIPRFAYSYLPLRMPWVDGFVVNMWRNSVALSDLSYIRRLCLDQVMFFPPSRLEALNRHWGSTEYARLDFEYQHYETGSIFMENAADIILLCGLHLDDLKLNFTYSVGFSEEMICAISHIKSLKKLIIQGAPDDNLLNDTESIAAVLSSVSSLESLSLNFATLETMSLEAGSLPNLIHFWMSYHPTNLNAVLNFVETEGKGIKLLEYMPIFLLNQSFRVFLSLRESVESVFINGIPANIPDAMLSAQFPNLRVVRCRYVSTAYHNPNWLQLAMFEKMEVLIMDWCEDLKYWRKVLFKARNTKLNKPPGLKHFIFITGDFRTPAEVVTDLFRRQGISFHFRSELTHTDILELLDNLKNNINIP